MDAVDRGARLVGMRRLGAVALGFILAALIFKGYQINLPQVYLDTNYYLNISANYIDRGEVTPYMWRLDTDTNIIAGSGTGYAIYLLALYFKIAGLSVEAGRTLMYVLGIVNLVVLFFFVRDWLGTPIAIAATAFGAINGLFFTNLIVRMDAPGALVYTLVLWLHVVAVRRDKAWLHFATGVAAIATTEVHILGLFYVGGLAFYYAVTHLRVWLRERKLWVMTGAVYYAAGAFIAGVVYLFIHVLPNPEAYLVIAANCEFCTPASIGKEFIRYFTFFYLLPIEAAVVALAVVAALVRRRTEDTHLLLIFAGVLITAAAVSSPPNITYSSHFWPLMAVMVGALVVRGFDPNGMLTRRRLQVAMVVGVVMLVKPFGDSFAPQQNLRDDPRVAYVQAYVPTDEVVMADPNFYHTLLDYPRFLSYDDGELFSIILRDEDYLTFYEREQPAVFFGDPFDEGITYDDTINDALWTYMQNEGFREIQTDLWVEHDLLENIAAEVEPPTVAFSVDNTTLEAGDCTRVRWTVTDALHVYWDGHEVEPDDSRAVCVYVPTTYTLRVEWAGGVENIIITVEVE